MRTRTMRVPVWRGIIPSLAMAAMLVCTALVAFEIGRYHRSPRDFVEAVRDRVVYVQPEWMPAEPGKAGRNR
jgi:hypothetical protein